MIDIVGLAIEYKFSGHNHFDKKKFMVILILRLRIYLNVIRDESFVIYMMTLQFKFIYLNRISNEDLFHRF